jgi:hypothetical protein
MNARRIAGAIWLAQPSHVLTLTQVGNSYEDIRKRMAKFFESLRKTYPTLRYTWQVEENPKATGNHALCFLHLADATISKAIIEKATSRVGLGPHFKLSRVPINASATFFGYQFKDLLDPEGSQRYLSLNGTPERQLLVHSSATGFWRDPGTGELLTRDEAESIALNRSHRIMTRSVKTVPL